jgi:hypothetical protein
MVGTWSPPGLNRFAQLEFVDLGGHDKNHFSVVTGRVIDLGSS